MKKLALHMLALAVLATSAVAGGSGWQTDFEKAAKRAKKKERPVLIEFTDGEASKALNKQVFYTGKFKTWAKKNVVLLEINFAKKVNSKLAAQYEDLKKKYKVETLPTLVLVDHEGKEIGRPAFSERGGLESFLTEMSELAEAASGAGKWTTDYEAAKQMSKRTKKPMLVDFNGSDW